jgi:hypothetical protein
LMASRFPCGPSLIPVASSRSIAGTNCGLRFVILGLALATSRSPQKKSKPPVENSSCAVPRIVNEW